MNDIQRPSNQQLQEHAMTVLEIANWMHECGYRTMGQQLETAAKALSDAARVAVEPPAVLDEATSTAVASALDYADSMLYDTPANASLKRLANEVRRLRASQPPAPVRRCHHAFDVLVITTAYESGFGHGQSLDELPNPYQEGSPEHHAYSIGYDEGERRRRMNGSSGYCNQGEHETCTNIDKQCMCKCHSPTKEARPFTPMDREQLREKIAAGPDPEPEIGAGTLSIDWNEVGPVDAKECSGSGERDE